ncbi:RnfH family protein [Halomonas sp. 18H]|uniref:RnfH family protein n=1 Tax=Halomonas almeriensis TaxID=308163 RepID=UPI002232A7D1|nr:MULTISPECIES: RnfH family protein [Halomonas]MCW4153565.1 RnfH family protein [Halomonas sp. 18H]MDN3552378.1 RnfH family protein [Halomonas almeriensis]
MAAEAPGRIQVEVAYALPSRQRIITLSVPAGTTAREAVQQADLPSHFPEVSPSDFAQAPLGLFGKALNDPHQVLREGDRVEVYRPLKIDPKSARLARAAARRDWFTAP